MKSGIVKAFRKLAGRVAHIRGAGPSLWHISPMSRGADTARIRPSSRLVWAAAGLVSMLLGACNDSTSTTTISSSSAMDNELDAVTCAGASRCIAVGSVHDYHRKLDLTLIEEDTGSGWIIVPSPTVSSGLGSKLSGVTCANTAHCIAVGFSSDLGSSRKTLIEENTGGGWTIVPSPNPSAYGGNGQLEGVTCASATHCIAVGNYDDNGFFQTLIEESNGAGWTIVPSRDSGEDSLSRVACTSASRCIAVGSLGIGNAPLIEENTGSGWAIVPVDGAGGLTDVSCASRTYCIGVGFSGDALYGERPVTVENTGGGWTNIPTSPTDAALNGITCPSNTVCIAIGNLAGGGTFMEQKTGGEWMVLPGVNASNSSTYGHLTLNAVACAGADHCIIVGAQFMGADYVSALISRTLIVENNGGGWLLVSSPNVTAGISR